MSTCVLWCVAVLALLVPRCCSQSQHGIDTCHPWLKSNKSDTGSSCVCGNTDIAGNVVTCNQTLQMSYLLLDYCMTYNNITNNTQLFYCPYEISTKRFYLKNPRQIVLNTTVSKLIKDFCGPLKREGAFCEQCKQNHGPSVFNQNLQCINCSSAFSGWMPYFTMEYFPLTVFFCIIILTGITPLSGSMNSFVMLSQLISLLFTYGNQDQLIPPYGNTTRIIVKFVGTAYGFWNLDFFRGVADNFCVSSKLNNLQAISLHLMSPFYPPFLLIVASIFIFLYNRNCRLFIKIWKPFKRCLSHYSVPNDTQSYMIRLFVTFYLLGYTKILHTCTLLLAKGYLFTIDGNKLFVVLMSPDVGYFSTEHAFHASVALFLLMIVIIAPAVYLTIHPLLEKRWGQFTHFKFIQSTADTFSSCFRDGQDGKMDCRHFAGGFLLLRIVAVMLFAVIWSPLDTYLTLTAVFILAAIIVGVCRPYKKKIHNILDITFFSLLAIGILCASITSFFDMSDTFQKVFTAFVLLSFFVPLLYASLYISYRLVKLVTALVTCCCKKRRRQYEEVTNYDDYLTSSNEPSGVSDYGSTRKK